MVYEGECEMGASVAPWSEERVERILARLLRIGVSTAAAIVLAGGVLYLVRHGGEQPRVEVFRGEPRALRNVAGILSAAASLQAQGIIQLGVLVLVCTPIARVIFTVFAFARARDYTYVVVALVVLGILLFSLLQGR
jgi:uncharacterized membrane protein